MFFVSDISGAQTPYSEELLRLQRERLNEASLARTNERLEQEAFAQAQEPLAPGTDLEHPLAAGSAGGRSVNSPGSGTEIPTIAAGMAGGSALHRGRESAEASGAHGESESAGTRRRRSSSQEEVPAVTRSRQVKRDTPDSEQFEIPAVERKVNPYEKLNRPIQKREPALKASQIMSTPVITLRKTDNLEKASKLFRAKRFRHVPITSEEGKLVGILSDRDVLTHQDSNTMIGSVMTTHILSARPDTEIRLIAQVLFKERIGAMPIVNENEKLVGILTRSDILRIVVNQAPLALWV